MGPRNYISAEDRAARDAKVARLNLEGMRDCEIARAMGIGPDTVARILDQPKKRQAAEGGGSCR